MALKICMKKSDERAAKVIDFELPDWSGMDDSTARITPEMAFAYCEQYPRWVPELFQIALAQRPPKCEVEFVL